MTSTRLRGLIETKSVLNSSADTSFAEFVTMALMLAVELTAAIITWVVNVVTFSTAPFAFSTTPPSYRCFSRGAITITSIVLPFLLRTVSSFGHLVIRVTRLAD